jgi:hypothetical protein
MVVGVERGVVKLSVETVGLLYLFVRGPIVIESKSMTSLEFYPVNGIPKMDNRRLR